MTMADKPMKKPPRSSSSVVLDGAKVDELVREIEDDATKWGELLPREEWPTRGRGRPSLTGHASQSPRVSFRLEPEVRDRAAARADREGKSLSALAREALEEYLAS
jgi:hypothetical protein